MSKRKTGSTVGLSALTSILALAFAISGGLFALVLQFGNVISDSTAGIFLIVSGTVLGLIFLRMVLDRDVRHAVNCANRDMRDGDGSDRYYFQMRSIPLLDPVWGLFGSRLGSPFFNSVRLTLFSETLLMLVINGRGPVSLALLITGSALGITMLLSMIQLTTHYPRHSGDVVDPLVAKGEPSPTSPTPPATPAP